MKRGRGEAVLVGRDGQGDLVISLSPLPGLRSMFGWRWTLGFVCSDVRTMSPELASFLNPTPPKLEIWIGLRPLLPAFVPYPLPHVGVPFLAP